MKLYLLPKILFTLFHCIFPEESLVLLNWNIKYFVNDPVIISSCISEVKWKCRDICILLNPTFFQQHSIGVCSSSVPYIPCWHPFLELQGAGSSCPGLGTLISRACWGKGGTGWIQSCYVEKKVIYTCTHRLADQTQRNVAQRNHMLLGEIRCVCQVSGLLKTRTYLEIGEPYIQVVL